MISNKCHFLYKVVEYESGIFFLLILKIAEGKFGPQGQIQEARYCFAPEVRLALSAKTLIALALAWERTVTILLRKLKSF